MQLSDKMANVHWNPCLSVHRSILLLTQAESYNLSLSEALLDYNAIMESRIELR